MMRHKRIKKLTTDIAILISDFNDLNHIRELLQEEKTEEFYIGVKRMTEQMKEQYRKYNE